jgi:drug/metabolite transporter (DMT)-like permease
MGYNPLGIFRCGNRLRPATGGVGLFYLLPLAMAVANALLHVLTHYGGRNESPATLVILGGARHFSDMSTWDTAFLRALSPHAVLLLTLGGTFGTFGHLLIAAAFQRGQTDLVSPLIYSQILWATIAGYLVLASYRRPLHWLGPLW